MSACVPESTIATDDTDMVVYGRVEETNEQNEETANYSVWNSINGKYYPSYGTVSKLPAGEYGIEYDNSHNLHLYRKHTYSDDLIVLPDTTSEEILESIKKFWKREHLFRKHGFLWKRGILIWGPPGGGKTTTIHLLSKNITEAGGITVYGNVDCPEMVSEGLSILRKIEPHRPVIVVLEDIDAVTNEHTESELLSVLDGEEHIDNVVYLATTNYPEKLDKRIVNRPSRFDEVIYVGSPTREAREVFLSKKNPRLAENVEEMNFWVEQTKGLSIAHLKELIVSVECLGNDLEETIKRLKNMEKGLSSERSPDKSPFGFGAE